MFGKRSPTHQDILEAARKGLDINEGALAFAVASSPGPLEPDLVSRAILDALKCHAYLPGIADAHPDAFTKLCPDLRPDELPDALVGFKQIRKGTPQHDWLVTQVRKLMRDATEHRHPFVNVVGTLIDNNVDLRELTVEFIDHGFGTLVLRLLKHYPDLALSPEQLAEVAKDTATHWRNLEEGLERLARVPKTIVLPAMLDAMDTLKQGPRYDEALKAVVEAASPTSTPKETLDRIEAAVLQCQSPYPIIAFAHKVRDARDVTALRDRLRRVLYPTPAELAMDCINSGRIVSPTKWHDPVLPQFGMF